MYKLFYRKTVARLAMLFCLLLGCAALVSSDRAQAGENVSGYDTVAMISVPGAYAPATPIVWDAPSADDLLNAAPTKTPQIKKAVLSSKPGRTAIIPKASGATQAWNDGLTAWRAGDYNVALVRFTLAATAENTNTESRARAAFWASRAAAKIGDAQKSKSLRILAAEYDRTFYGLIAAEQLGQNVGLSWAQPQPSATAIEKFQKHPLAVQAMAHVTNGRLSQADQTLIKIAGTDADMRLAALAFAMRTGLPATALRLAPMVERDTGIRYDAAYYPLGSWIDANDFRVDRALVHAVIRQESKFDATARSGQGAVGLMQVIPSTASYMIKVKGGGAAKGKDLTGTLHNLDVGQHYLEYLAGNANVSGDIVKMLVAYNAGPGNLAKWNTKLADVGSDQLLFIESIPSAETRAYVQHVMSNYWIYRNRLGMNNPTLAAIAGERSVAVNIAPQKSWFASVNLDRLMGM